MTTVDELLVTHMYCSGTVDEFTVHAHVLFT
jgi:hypothetical protein